MTTGNSLRFILTTGRFAKVVTSSLETYGIKKDSVLYLAGDYSVPMDKEDPYTFRKVFIAAKLVDGHIDNVSKGFVVDPKHLRAIPEDDEDALQAIRDVDFRKLEDG